MESVLSTEASVGAEIERTEGGTAAVGAAWSSLLFLPRSPRYHGVSRDHPSGKGPRNRAPLSRAGQSGRTSRCAWATTDGGDRQWDGYAISRRCECRRSRRRTLQIGCCLAPEVAIFDGSGICLFCLTFLARIVSTRIQ